MVGILILKLAYAQAGLVLILMVLTYFAKSSLRGSYEPAALSLPLEIAKVCNRQRMTGRGIMKGGKPS